MATTNRRTATLALAHALSAAEHGLPVIPLSATKLPALRSPHRDEHPSSGCRGACGRPGHGVHDATTDPAEVRARYPRMPDFLALAAATDPARTFSNGFLDRMLHA